MGGSALYLAAVLLLCFPASSYSQLYNLITPNVLRVDTEEKIVVEAHGLGAATEVTVTIYDFPQKKKALYMVKTVLDNTNHMMATPSIKCSIGPFLWATTWGLWINV
ncbi:venom factor-like [Paroedura picta]|uniref:venom factor-like n=1 Tax=Paroedura picta TaxID=143630 RepID=UPI0040570D1A